MKLRQKLASRKLWVAVGGVLAVLATEWANISPEFADKIIGAIVIIVPSYVGGQSLVDALAALARGKAAPEVPAVPAKKAAKKSARTA